MLPHSSDKINEFIRQAASMHVLNTVYFIGLVVVALFTYTLLEDKTNLSLFHSAAGYILLATFLFKVLIQNVSQLQKKLSDSQVELVVTAFNVVGTFLLFWICTVDVNHWCKCLGCQYYFRAVLQGGMVKFDI